MGVKVRSKYRAFTATQLKNRSSIPSQSDITVNGNNIECVNISLARVKNLIGEPYFSVPSVCASNKVNVYSGFGPTIRTVPGGLNTGSPLVHNAPTNSDGYFLANFAGYNHYAEIIHYESITHNQEEFAVPGQSVTFSVQVYLGEIRLTDTDIVGCSDTDRALALIIYDGASILQRPDTSRVWDIHDLTQTGSYLNGDYLIVELVTTYTIPVGQLWAKEYTGKIYLSNNLTGFSPDLSNAICRFSELPSYTKKFKIKAPNHVYISAPYCDGKEYNEAGGIKYFGQGSTIYWELKDFQWLTSNGQLSFYYIKVSTNNLGGTYTHMTATVKVQEGYYDTDGVTWVGTDIAVPNGVNPIYDGAWSQVVNAYTIPASPPFTGTDIWDGGTIDTSGYGYRVYFFLNVS